MNNVFALRNAASTIASTSKEVTTAPRRAALAQLLREAACIEAEVLYPLLAALLEAHLDHGHDDDRGNTRIRDGLDNVELLLALDIERMGLRRSPETPCTTLQRSRS